MDRAEKMLLIKGHAQMQRNEMRSIESLDMEMDISDAWQYENNEIVLS